VSDERPPESSGPGWLGCAATALAVWVAFAVAWLFGGSVALAAGGVALAGAVVLMFQRDPGLRTAGAALLGVLAVAMLLFGACFKAVEGI
jgi:hypothetical protein